MIVKRNVAWGSDLKVVMATLLVMGPGLVSCDVELTCLETATCPATVPGPDGSAEAGGDAGAPRGDAGNGLDASEPPDTLKDSAVDLPKHDDVDIDSAVDTPWALDVASDIASEADALCDTSDDRSPVDTPCLIDARYGVFVSPQGNDNPAGGTPTAPYKTLAYAMDSAKKGGKRVYVCDDGAGYADALAVGTVVDGLRLYGGFECGTWTYATTRRARVHPAAGSALFVRGLVAGLTLEDFELASADAAPGASSIASIIEASANVTLRGVKLTAGKGGNGADGPDGAKPAEAPDVDEPQQGKPGNCSAGDSQPGAWSSPSSCSSLGGAGGQPTNGVGTNGFPGDPRDCVFDVPSDNGGLAGNIGADGTIGSEGYAGNTGKPNLSSGSFSALGYTAAGPGGPGVAGCTGQGGGGGGASHAPAVGCIGASGGAGGMGGCGGLAGAGGSSGAASIALLSWMSQITLDRCDLLASDGGAGGKGGNGSLGNAGKPGANGGGEFVSDGGGVTIGKAGSGGPGGHGGNGGSGAGGNGGPSYALVYKGTAPIKSADTTLVYGAGGAKGIGGTLMGAKALDGLTGAASDQLILP